MALPVPKEQAEEGTWREKHKRDSVLIFFFFFLLLSSFTPSTIFFSYLLLLSLSTLLSSLPPFLLLSPSLFLYSCFPMFSPSSFPIYFFCLWPFLPAPTQGLQILRLVKCLDSPFCGHGLWGAPLELLWSFITSSLARVTIALWLFLGWELSPMCLGPNLRSQRAHPTTARKNDSALWTKDSTNKGPPSRWQNLKGKERRNQVWAGGWAEKQPSPQNHFTQEGLVIILPFLSAFTGSLRFHVSLFSRALFPKMSLMAL